MLKDIVERSASSAPAPPQLPSPNSTGFPVPVHRSKRPSAFAKARQTRQARQDGKQEVGFGRAVDTVPSVQVDKVENDQVIRKQVEEENVERVEAMSSQEREQEIQELEERFGDKLIGALRKRAEVRRMKSDPQPAAGPSKSSLLDGPVDVNDAHKVLEGVSEENERRIEAMSVQERLAEAEELRERFGDKIMDALQKRAEGRLWKRKEKVVDQAPLSSVLKTASIQANEDIDPAALKANYFPSIEVAKSEWLQPVSTTSDDRLCRFDLSGTVLSADAKASLPTHLGLHHHGDSPDLAGYTLQDILYLCQSTVPSQRITMMGVLGKILGKSRRSQVSEDVTKELEEMQAVQRAIELGVHALAGLARGAGVIRASVDLLFEALGGPSWSWEDDAEDIECHQPFIGIQKSASSDPIGIAAIPFEDVFPRLMELLSIPDALSPSTTRQLLLILRRATLSSSALCETLCPLIPVVIKYHVVQKPWPSTAGNSPDIEGLRLLRDITASSRDCAEDLLSEGVYETTLKFIVTATWREESDVDDSELGQSLALEVFRTYTILGRYGLSASVVTSSSEIWRRFGAWVRDRCAPSTPSRLESILVRAYFDLLQVWITCAIDPHRTKPEHDITWAQVAALGWAEEAIDAIKALQAGKTERLAETSSALDMLCSWVTGSKINGSKGGEDEKKAVLEGLAESGIDYLVKLLRAGDFQKVRLCTAAVSLHNQLESSGDLLSPEAFSTLRQALFADSQPIVRSHIYLRYELLRSGLQRQAMPLVEWLSIALELSLSFQVGDESIALDLVDEILNADWSATPSPIAEQYTSLSHADRLQVLRPLLHFTILPDVEKVVAPLRPSHLYLKATNTLRAPPLAMNHHNISGLPLQPDWLFSPVNELLRSGSSIALSQVPPDWSASEIEIVQAVLILGQLQCALPGWESRLGRSTVSFNMMKVFMLEHGQQNTSICSDGEVFRDGQVATGMKYLMSTLIAPSATSSISEAAPLETVSLPFLTAGVPFFQFYTDFLALYEAISFSDLLFSQLLCLPLSMSYPADYRKLLWNDHSTALRGMRVNMSQVPLEGGSGVDAYFEPRESNGEVLSGYARALSKGWVTEERNQFLFRMAIHHLAALFWESKEEGKESIRVQLLVGVLATGQDGLIKGILEWDLLRRGDAMVTEEEKRARKDSLGVLTGVKGTKRVENL